MLEKGRPLPPILVYDEGASTLPELHERMAPFVRQQVDERTLRQTVLDELLRRKTQFAMRFRKSA
jgi:hypothetical protein